ncbi:hypothetical protein AMJ47_03965 [Parcubacteria bacterium DG_72]|nr:MAG: hypothetical protein AMJ47_03965 [Parcubacteria bacterium DG_72]
MSEYRFLKKLKKIKRKKEIEPQEIFLDKLASKKEEESGLSEKKLEVPVSEKIILAVFFFFIILVLALFGKTFQFQILEKDSFLAQAEENKFIIDSIKAERGVIYDANGKQLAFNKASFDLILDKEALIQGKEAEVLQKAGLIVNMDLSKVINQEGRYFLIKENLDHQTLIVLETRIKELQGFEVVKNSTRQYTQEPCLSHLIGYIGKITSEELKTYSDIYSGSDYIGKEGLEKSYEDILRTNPGKIQIEKDVYGNIISKEIMSLPESGNSLVLWIDSDLQKKIEQELIKTLERIGAKKAVGVALNPQNGGVLALVNIPSYDNNLFTREANQEDLQNLLNDEEKPLFNRAISGLYATGSSVKPFVAAAALQEQIISADKSLNCQGKISVPHKYDPEIIYEYNDWTVHGPTDMRKAIAESCNVYFYTIGGGYKNQQGLGPTRIKQYLELFGWGKETGIDLPGESNGLIPDPEWKQEKKGEGWWDGDTYNLSIGQGDIMITPLQVAVAFSAIANKGTLFAPRVVKEIIDSNKNIVKTIEKEIIRQNFIDLQNLEIVRQGMRRAVTGQGAPYASSITLNSLPVAVASKTGTAQTPYKEKYHNWVTVFAPYDNPEIVLTIMIENVPGVQVAALPTAKNILQWYFTK